MILTLPCATCGWNDDCPHNIKYCVINNGYKHKFEVHPIFEDSKDHNVIRKLNK